MANGPQCKPGYSLVPFVGDTQPKEIKGLSVFYGRVLVATDLGVYMLTDDDTLEMLTPSDVHEAIYACWNKDTH